MSYDSYSPDSIVFRAACSEAICASMRPIAAESGRMAGESEVMQTAHSRIAKGHPCSCSSPHTTHPECPREPFSQSANCRFSVRGRAREGAE